MTVQQKQLKVLVIGDACLDRYAYTKNTRVNPEAPALLINYIADVVFPGMALNVTNCLVSLGVEVDICTPPDDQVALKLRYVDIDTKTQILRVDDDRKVEPFTDGIENINQYDAVVISDYCKGFVTYDLIDYICKEYDGPIFMDTKKKDIAKYSRIFIKINEHEANALDKTPEGVPPYIIVTMGANGVTFFNETWPALKVNLVDVCGAGDAFLAGIVYGFLTDESNMMEYGIVNAGLSVKHLGPYAPSLEELNQGLNDYDVQCRSS